jgi:hypothetical protein
VNKKLTNFISPKGIAKWPRLDQPYSWNDAAGRNMPDPDGQYECLMSVSKKDAQALIAAVDAASKEAGFKPKHLPYKPEVDKDTGEETGNIEFKFKAYGKRKDGSKNRVLFFDAKGRPVPSDVRLTNGSTIRCLGYITVARLGARLNLKEIQIIDLIEQQASGFDEVEGSFVFDDEDAEVTITNGNYEEADERPAF